MVGPMDFTTNDEIGLLIAGHERPPVILCQCITRATSGYLSTISGWARQWTCICGA
jgi:hypothetical protein